MKVKLLVTLLGVAGVAVRRASHARDRWCGVLRLPERGLYTCASRTIVHDGPCCWSSDLCRSQSAGLFTLPWSNGINPNLEEVERASGIMVSDEEP